MSNPMIRIHNVETNEIIDREMNDVEYAQYQIDQANFAAKEQAITEQAATKAALLARLGITQEEANLLIGGSN
jgi:hypothetical protein